MQKTYILHHELGLRVAVRLSHGSERGVIARLTQTRVHVHMADGTIREFSRSSGTQVGATGHKWLRPYLTTVAEAEDRDQERAAANLRAADRMAKGQSPHWLAIKGGQLNGYS